VTIIPPGVETELFLRRGPPKVPRRNGRATVLVPARLTPIKDPLLALDVLRRCPADVRLVFLGDGPSASETAAAVARDAALRGRVEFWPPCADVRPHYEASDVVLLTSRSEGTPLCLIEAQLAGTPVVAPDVGGTSSVVLPGGGKVVAREADALAAAVIEAIETTPSPEVATAVAARFSAARLCRDVESLYERLLRGEAP
jgi:glycosyltransferase involved in cell wall biosynthesis